jgi:3-hydroxyisobutyrate dehydrogenase-like beta-hydroxyacid dehydrogenase
MTTDNPHVAVLGLGAMGSALARALVEAGHPTIVWNRTAQRAAPLVAIGATAATDPASAVEGAELVVTSLVDGAAALDVLSLAASALRDRTVVELTSVTPRQARAIGDLVRGEGAAFLSGAVMVPPQMIGTEDAVILLDGDRAGFDRSVAALAAIAPTPVFVGDEVGAAALLDMGLLDVFYGAVTSFVHAATLVGTGGVKPTEFLEHGSSMLELAGIVAQELARELADGSFPGDDNNLAMMLRGIDHVVETAEERGVDPALPLVTAELMRAAVDQGYGRDGYGRIAELLRR